MTERYKHPVCALICVTLAALLVWVILGLTEIISIEPLRAVAKMSGKIIMSVLWTLRYVVIVALAVALALVADGLPVKWPTAAERRYLDPDDPRIKLTRRQENALLLQALLLASIMGVMIGEEITRPDPIRENFLQGFLVFARPAVIAFCAVIAALLAKQSARCAREAGWIE